MIISALLPFGKTECGKGSKRVNLLLINDYVGVAIFLIFLVYMMTRKPWKRARQSSELTAYAM